MMCDTIHTTEPNIMHFSTQWVLSEAKWFNFSSQEGQKQLVTLARTV